MTQNQDFFHKDSGLKCPNLSSIAFQSHCCPEGSLLAPFFPTEERDGKNGEKVFKQGRRKKEEGKKGGGGKINKEPSFFLSTAAATARSEQRFFGRA